MEPGAPSVAGRVGCDRPPRHIPGPELSSNDAGSLAAGCRAGREVERRWPRKLSSRARPGKRTQNLWRTAWRRTLRLRWGRAVRLSSDAERRRDQTLPQYGGAAWAA